MSNTTVIEVGQRYLNPDNGNIVTVTGLGNAKYGVRVLCEDTQKESAYGHGDFEARVAEGTLKLVSVPVAVEYAPGQFGDLVRRDGDAFSFDTCATCGDAIGYAGYAERKGDRAKVHFIRNANRGGSVLNCKTGTHFETNHDGTAA